jgi:hypothetical protein
LPPGSRGREILSLLLDRYERSAAFKTGMPPERRIRLRLYDSGISDYKPYNIENTEARREINRDVRRLEEQRLVNIRWMKGEVDHFIAQVSLNADSAETITAAYTYLGRTPKNVISDAISRETASLLDRVSAPWIRAYLEDCLDSLSGGRKSGGKLPAAAAERENLFRALAFIDGQADKAEVLERVFSTRCFGNSKTFEVSVKKRLLEIIRRYSESEEDSGDEELLAFAGIVRYPERFEFRGGLSICMETGGRVDFSPLRYGASISALDAARGRLELSQLVSRVLSVENKANYVSLLRQNDDPAELVVYHGGQFSPQRGLFFRALAALLPAGGVWRHWGDIDYGGFSMLARLRREVCAETLPFRMGEHEISARLDRAIPVTDAYALKLQSLLLREELADCLPCINFMLERRVKMEQEALLDDI